MLAVFVILSLGLLHVSHSAPLDDLLNINPSSIPPDCLLNVGRSAAPDCQQLLRPVDHVLPQDLEGRWTLVAGGLDSPSAVERFKIRDSALIHLKVINGTRMHYMRNDGFNESCRYIDFEFTLEGSGFRVPHLNLTVIYIHTTCPDCFVIHFETDDKSPQPLYLMSRRRKVGSSEMTEFVAQVSCLQKPYVEHMDPTKKLCERDVNNETQEKTVEDGGQSA